MALRTCDNQSKAFGQLFASSSHLRRSHCAPMPLGNLVHPRPSTAFPPQGLPVAGPTTPIYRLFDPESAVLAPPPGRAIPLVFCLTRSDNLEPILLKVSLRQSVWQAHRSTSLLGGIVGGPNLVAQRAARVSEVWGDLPLAPPTPGARAGLRMYS